jgi:cytidylate kinase
VIWGAPVDTASELIDQTFYRREAERVIWELAAAGSGVVLGRAGAVVLRNDSRALHARLDGPAARRIEQAMVTEGIDWQTAALRQAKTDRARELYVTHLYQRDPRDPALYHLVIDPTVIPLDACVQLIADAARARAQASSERQSRTTRVRVSDS